MMEKYSEQEEDKKFRQMLASTKIDAPENLKHRIMQQIETEKALAPQSVEPKKEPGNMLREMGAIFGTMYAVLAAMVAGVYFLVGKEFLLSAQFLGSVILVASIFSLLWLISRLDSHLREKKRTR
jgi:predicted lipid-binding transport protein (Tim44 family)